MPYSYKNNQQLYLLCSIKGNLFVDGLYGHMIQEVKGKPWMEQGTGVDYLSILIGSV